MLDFATAITASITVDRRRTVPDSVKRGVNASFHPTVRTLDRVVAPGLKPPAALDRRLGQAKLVFDRSQFIAHFMNAETKAFGAPGKCGSGICGPPLHLSIDRHTTLGLSR
jgi:hypothetical protein